MVEGDYSPFCEHWLILATVHNNYQSQETNDSGSQLVCQLSVVKKQYFIIEFRMQLWYFHNLCRFASAAQFPID